MPLHPNGEFVFPASMARGQMPRKVAGQHRWIASVAHTMTTEGCVEAMKPDGGFVLDHESMLMVALGCYDCEQPFPIVRFRPCPAGDEWGDDR